MRSAKCLWNVLTCLSRFDLSPLRRLTLFSLGPDICFEVCKRQGLGWKREGLEGGELGPSQRTRNERTENLFFCTYKGHRRHGATQGLLKGDRIIMWEIRGRYKIRSVLSYYRLVSRRTKSWGKVVRTSSWGEKDNAAKRKAQNKVMTPGRWLVGAEQRWFGGGRRKLQRGRSVWGRVRRICDKGDRSQGSDQKVRNLPYG